jgi:phospholipase C
MDEPLDKIKHIIVVMLENRSFDNMLGHLSEKTPTLALPEGSPQKYDGIQPGRVNPENEDFFTGAPISPVAAGDNVDSLSTPELDPQETFSNVTYQIYGPEGYSKSPTWPMQGFVVNYKTRQPILHPLKPKQVMQSYTLADLPVLSTLAQAYAVSDAWFCSVPSQTWPNRSFTHSGTSNGNVDNGTIPDPSKWNVKTIFNVLQNTGKTWTIYSEVDITPSLTRIMSPQLWDDRFDDHFLRFNTFISDCKSGNLPQYAFIEPSFLLYPTDQHAPHDMMAGEDFLHKIWDAVSNSPNWPETLLIITYDEHGGCYDHVLPPSGATPPSPTIRNCWQRIWAKLFGQGESFAFDRFGIRVPMVVVSPWIQAGTVFRSNTDVPYDHTSILATLRDWLKIDDKDMLSSPRIKKAPTLAQVLTLSECRTDIPVISRQLVPAYIQPDDSIALNDLQKSLVTGSAQRFNLATTKEISGVMTREHALNFFNDPAVKDETKKDK